MRELIIVILFLGLVISAGAWRTDNIENAEEIAGLVNLLHDCQDQLDLAKARVDTVVINPVIKVNALVTAYAPDSASCWPYNDGFTATMKDAKLPGVAVDPNRIPFGSIVVIDGVPYEADDTGHAMREANQLHIDLRFPTREEALAFGRQEKVVEVILR